YLALRGRCRYCKKSLSKQYAVIEIISALLFAGGFWLVWHHAISHQLFSNGASAVWWFMFSLVVVWASIVLMMALGVYDYRWGQLPNQWTIGLSGVLLI